MTTPATDAQPPHRPSEDLIGKIIGNRFYVGQFVAGGSFGSFHFGYERDTKQKVAIKLEKRDIPQPQLHLEVYYYRSLGTVTFIPKVHYFGPCGDDLWSGLVMDLLGPSLLGMRDKVCGGSFSICTTTAIAIQMINMFEYIHEHGILYRDIKPENFLIGQSNTDKWCMVNLIDLGFCKRYLDEDNRHIAYVEGKPIAGTQRYMSVHNHLGHELGRRDDLEAILYMMVYLHKGELPWQGLQGTPKEKNTLTVQIKQQITPGQLCTSMPVEFANYLKYVRELKFEDRPRYGMLMNWFRFVLIHLGTRFEDQKYDWDREHNSVKSA